MTSERRKNYKYQDVCEQDFKTDAFASTNHVPRGRLRHALRPLRHALRPLRCSYINPLLKPSLRRHIEIRKLFYSIGENTNFFKMLYLEDYLESG